MKNIFLKTNLSHHSRFTGSRIFLLRVLNALTLAPAPPIEKRETAGAGA